MTPPDDMPAPDDELGGEGEDAPVDEAQSQGPSEDQAKPDFDHHARLFKWMNSKNIAADLDQEMLNQIGMKVVREYEIDKLSRSEWEEKTTKAMELATQVAKEKQYPWPKAANVIFPLMTNAAIQFAARAYPAIISDMNVVKGIVIGEDNGKPLLQNGKPVPGPDGKPLMIIPPGAKRVRADKIGEHMSWQLLDEQPEWEPDTDYLLHVVPIVGCMFRKTYFSPDLGRNASTTISPLQVVINYKAKSLETVPRITEELQLYPLQIEEKELAGVFLPYTYGPAPNGDGDDDAPHDFLEQHRYLDLDKDGYPEPYIVTVHKETSRVTRIVARYDADGVRISPTDYKIVKIDPIHYYTKFDFLPNPEGGIYGFGFGQLLRPINEAVNTTLNMMLDAGHLQVVGGGFIGKGLSMAAGNVRFVAGEWKNVNVSGATARDNIVPLQFPGPSPVLFQLLGVLIDAGKEISSVKDILTGENQNANTPATTILAIIEQGLKVFTAIYKRIHRSLKSEYNKLYRLNRKYLPIETSYRLGDNWKTITQDDYAKGAGVEPVSDPTMVSDMQRLGRAQFLLGFKDDPLFNPHEIRKRVLDAAQIEKPDLLLLPQAPPNPLLIMKTAELHMKGDKAAAEVKSEWAAKTKDLAQAIYYLAAADKAVGDQKLAGLEQMMDLLRIHMEQVNNGGTAPGPDGTGNNPGGLPGMAPPPMQQNVPQVSPGLAPLGPPQPAGPMGG